jgi:hypothetical protein
MISTDCRIESFLVAIAGKPSAEAIFLAHQEATEAERQLLRSRANKSHSTPCPDAYVNRLKEFIGFARYAVMQSCATQDKYHHLYHAYLERA